MRVLEMYVIYCTYIIQVEAKPPSDLSTLEENIFKVYIFHVRVSSSLLLWCPLGYVVLQVNTSSYPQSFP